MSVNDYVLQIKTLGHSLATIGEPPDDKELLLAIINGLDHDYETVVSLITYQMDKINIEKVQYLLLMHEQRLLSKNLPLLASTFNSELQKSSGMKVNMAQSTRTGSCEFVANRGGYMTRGGSSINRGGRGRGRSSNRRVYCQLCGKSGHFADKCYHRFDRNFQRIINSGFGRFNNGDGQSKSKAYMPTFSGFNGAYMNNLGSVPSACYSNFPQPVPSAFPGAYYSNFPPQPDNLSQSSASAADPAWFVDSSATNHITSNLGNLYIHIPYIGDDKVAIGNGKTLPISHVGYSDLYTHQQPASILYLPNVLHVPNMKKN